MTSVVLAVAACLAQAPDPAVLQACRWIEGHADVARRADEPCKGLLLATATLALQSAGHAGPARLLARDLEHLAPKIVSTPARALAIVALITGATPDEWRARGPVVDALMDTLLQAQDLREWRTRRSLLAARGGSRTRSTLYGGFGLNLAGRNQDEHDGNPNFLSTALAALALRSYSRIGMELVPRETKAGKGSAAESRIETWPAIVQFVVLNQSEAGSLPAWPGTDEGSRGATTLGALALALARPELAPLGRDAERFEGEFAAATESLDRALRWLGSAPGDPGLVELAFAARLAWSCGARDVATTAPIVALLPAADGRFDARIEPTGRQVVAEAARWYAAEEPRAFLATALFVLAKCEAGQSCDGELHHTLLSRLAPAALPPPKRALFGELLASDGAAGLAALSEQLERDVAWPDDFVVAAMRGRSGWDFGLSAASNEEKRSRALLRWRRFLFDDRQRDPGRQHAAGRVALGIRSLLGDEVGSEAAELATLWRALDRATAVAELDLLLASRDQETRVAASRFVELLGIDLGAFDSAADPAAAAAVAARAALAERLRAY